MLEKLILKPVKYIMLTNNCELLIYRMNTESLQFINFIKGMTFVNYFMLTVIDKDGWINSLQ